MADSKRDFHWQPVGDFHFDDLIKDNIAAAFEEALGERRDIHVSISPDGIKLNIWETFEYIIPWKSVHCSLYGADGNTIYGESERVDEGEGEGEAVTIALAETAKWVAKILRHECKDYGAEEPDWLRGMPPDSEWPDAP